MVGAPTISASTPNGRKARGDSGRPSSRPGWPRGSAMRLEPPVLRGARLEPPTLRGAGLEPPGPPGRLVPVPDDPQAVQGEPGVVTLDALAGVQHGAGQAAGGDHRRLPAELGRHAPDDPVDLAGEPPDGAGLEALDGVLADHRAGRHQLDAAELGGPRSEE